MLNTEFIEYFEKCPAVVPHYLGCFSIDTFPKKIPTRSFLITNLSKSNEVGTHWITVLKSEPNLVEIFDSLGTKYDQLKPYLNFYKNPNLVFNDRPFQQPDSTTCGFYAITFSVERCMNFDMKFKEVLAHTFTTDLNKNEEIVKNFVEEL
jgi:hypothetical protein